MNERLAKAEGIFHDALELLAEERETFLQKACGEDGELRHEVVALLRAAGVAERWLKESESLSEGEGRVIGRYKLLEKIGEGGCGVVYMAEQEQPLRRRVALKVIKLGMDTRQVVARFEAERQALALMHHTNIAKVLDAGATEAGRPYFVMELVRGVRITKFCEENQLGIKERLELFVQVCNAIQHAHQKGIIHRDIKPSNVLVTLNDGVPHPMVIDFGVAKALNERLTEKTLFTAFAQMIGTPTYMSPEQAEMSKLDVDTRSDVYSLGVLLYELLTGTTPFSEERLRSAGYAEMQRIICEEEPERPSTRLTRISGFKTQSSRITRHASLPADLDWIVMKCLEKDRTRRYETASALALDIQRQLHNEPVLARPPSKRYRFQKLVRRNKLAFAAGTAVAAAVIIGLGLSMWLFVRERAALKIAGENAARAGAAVTRLEIEKAEQLFEADNSSAALAYLARILRQQPTNRVVAERILWALSSRNFALPTLAFEHGDVVNAACFSPDGTRVATASRDGTARVWDSVTGAPVTPPLPHQASVTTLRFSPDSSKLATGGAGKMACIWDPVSGHALTPPLQHSGAVVSLAFSVDGKLIATGSEDATAVVWHADTGKPLIAPLVHSNGVRAIAFSSDGKWLVSGAGNFAYVWDIENGRQQRMLNAGNTVHSARFSSDGQRILTASAPGLASVWEAATGKRGRSFGFTYSADSFPESATAAAAGAGAVEGATYGAEFSPEEARIAVGGSANFARVWDIGTGQTITPLMQHRGSVNGIRFSPDGWLILTASQDGTARVWDAESGKAVSEPLYHSGSVISAEFSPNAQRVLTLSDGANAAFLWELRRGQPAGVELPHYFGVAFARFSPDGRQAATASWDNQIRIWDTQTGQPVAETLFHSPQHMTSLSYSGDGRCILASSYYGLARVWDSQTGAEICPPLRHWDADSFRDGKAVYAAAFSSDGTRIITASADGTARVWNASNGMQLLTLRHEGAVWAAKFSPDDRHILTCSDDRTARMWDALDGRLIFQLTHRAAVLSAEFSRDGSTIVTASGEVAQRWDARIGQRLGSPMSHKDAVLSASFSPDGWKVLTRSGNTAHLWDLRQNGESVVLQHGGAIASAVFSSDGRRILTASLGGSARVWDAETGHPVSENIRHGSVNDAEFSRDGRWIITGGGGNPRALIAEVPPGTLPIPPWLADLAEALGGQRLDARNTSQSTGPAQLMQIGRAVSRSAAQDEYTRWAQWLFADNASRRISSSSLLTGRRWMEGLAYRKAVTLNLRRRDSETPPNLIDLSAYYNVSLTTLELPQSGEHAIPTWPQALDDVAFDTRGAIYLATFSATNSSLGFPHRVSGINVGQKCKRLHFLHVVAFGTAPGTTVAAFVIRHSDGTITNIPLKYGNDVRSMRVLVDLAHNVENPNSAVAWTGTSVSGIPVRLFRTTWKNPKPEVQVTTIDFISNLTDCAPILIALTAEP
jgi:eukaryotic-like serine/threonine-protein kinase